MNKVLFLDLETTGLDATKHGIIQIAMLIEIDGKVEGELSLDVQPFTGDWITLNLALKTTNLRQHVSILELKYRLI